MTQQDNVVELIKLVRDLQKNIDILEQNVAQLDAKVQKLNYLQKLLDVKVDSITFGDLLQYAPDGKWHNIQPDKVFETKTVASTVTKLSDLEDVIISSPVNGESITYSSNDKKWHNNFISGGGGGIDPGTLNNYLTKLEATNIYFPKAGGTIDGNVNIKGNLLTKGGVTIHSTII